MNLTYQIARFKKIAVYVLGVASEIVALGLLHGTAEQIVEGVVAALTGLGIAAARNAPETVTTAEQDWTPTA